ncbi:MAG: hypothetical protein ACN6OP_10400 [Pseudomonadales bacterium]
MPITIVKRGIPQRDIVYRTECKDCKSILDFKKGDVTAQSERNETLYKFKCPVCNHENYLTKLVTREQHPSFGTLPNQRDD